ncbi:MAG: glutamate 5-kinase [Myxococcales bacterium]|nr:glutamate 5-kinase [Myxococcales bacterium]MCB9644436.1 glutamate 5-kinase [Myxococcales bacterium]
MSQEEQRLQSDERSLVPNEGHRRVVIKLGTSVLTGGAPHLDLPRMVEIARQCAALMRAGHELLICSSGAIAAGRERLGFPTPSSSMAYKQMLAAVGQSRLMRVWDNLFEIYGIRVGQVLLTRADVESRDRFLNARDTLMTLLREGILPIINENDAVATEEIKVGDNDNLSALVATLCGADLLVLLTDIDGLYTANPHHNPEARLIAEVAEIDESIKQMAGGSVSGLGTGGMATKLQAAEIAQRMGTEVVIAAGHLPNVIERVVGGESLGTRFLAGENPLEQRKGWLLAGPRPQVSLVVDAGAADALRLQGRSLLASGLVAVEGEFRRGDLVQIRCPDAPAFARGIVRYDSMTARRIAGMRSEAIVETLGYSWGPLVHRNDLILV